MASTVTAERRRRVGADDEWLDEMKVTFDSTEMTSFFDRFMPLEIGDDLVPTLVPAANDDR